MPMPPYPIRCYTQGCANLAVFKIAARWSDGLTEELKTYALSCADCLERSYHSSRAKQAACRLARGEVLESPGVYDLARGSRDRKLKRRHDLESGLIAS